ncbi:MAG: hypothetical protein NTV93_20000 [Verrucomicrobia bacterium]|nr:hypothetical protein [Verrucomicrobiota bacterium]
MEKEPAGVRLFSDARQRVEQWIGNDLALDLAHTLAKARKLGVEFHHADAERKRNAFTPDDGHPAFAEKGRVAAFIKETVLHLRLGSLNPRLRFLFGVVLHLVTSVPPAKKAPAMVR